MCGTLRGVEDTARTPRDDGLTMPPEWAPHSACLMAWPARADLWGRFLEQAKLDYAAVATAIAQFEPVTMVCSPGDEKEVRDHCGGDVEPLPIPINDSWMRDSGPIFVTDGKDGVAMVHFRFNSWGEKYLPYDLDAQVPARLAEHFGIRRYEAPFVLEGGSFFVDGEGTLLTTEQCLLHPNRNPDMSRDEIEEGLRRYLGVERIVWLPCGMAGDRDTDGHVDGIAQYVRPGTIMLLNPRDESDDNYPLAQRNLARLETERDAAQRPLEVIPLDLVSYPEADGVRVPIPYLNFYFANRGVVVPQGGVPEDEEALAQIAEVFPDREVVGVPGTVLSIGGGGPHCITQQVPAGEPLV